MSLDQSCGHSLYLVGLEKSPCHGLEWEEIQGSDGWEKKIQWVNICSGGKAQVPPLRVEFYTMKYCGSCTVCGASGDFEDLWPFLRHDHCFSWVHRLSQVWLISMNEYLQAYPWVSPRYLLQGVVLHLSLIRKGHWHDQKALPHLAGSVSYWPFQFVMVILWWVGVHLLCAWTVLRKSNDFTTPKNSSPPLCLGGANLASAKHLLLLQIWFLSH